jgi:16S rRNA (guanine966-N2)-methyltransferase
MLRIIAGKFKGRQLKVPTATTRPTQGMLREAVFNICQSQIENAHILDLYAGSGAIGFEAISRGAAHAVLIEKNKQAVACIKQNMEILSVASQITLLPLDAPLALKRLKEAFDLIYVDPPYDLPIDPILNQLVESHLLKPEGILFVEERYDPKRTLKPFTSDKLFLKTSRRFGTAILHQYFLKKLY